MLNFKIANVINVFNDQKFFDNKNIVKKFLLKKNLKFKKGLKNMFSFKKILNSNKKKFKRKKMLNFIKNRKFLFAQKTKYKSPKLNKIVKKPIFKGKFIYNNKKFRKIRYNKKYLRRILRFWATLMFRFNLNKKIRFTKYHKKNWIKKYKKYKKLKKKMSRRERRYKRKHKKRKFNYRKFKIKSKSFKKRRKRLWKFKKGYKIIKFGKNNRGRIIYFNSNKFALKKANLKSYMNKYFLFLYYLKIFKLKRKFLFIFNVLFNYRVNINFLIFIKKYWGTLVTSDIVADWIILRLLQKNKIKTIMGTVIRFLKKKIKRKKLYGYAILIMGRFSRRDRATYSWYKKGPFTRSNKLINIDYTNRQVALRFSTCSFKINLIKSLAYKEKKK